VIEMSEVAGLRALKDEVRDVLPGPGDEVVDGHD